MCLFFIVIPTIVIFLLLLSVTSRNKDSIVVGGKLVN